jgi:hypothetical protein
MEFLGSLEKKHDFTVLDKIKSGVKEDKQRSEATKGMKEYIKKLRECTDYPG